VTPFLRRHSRIVWNRGRAVVGAPPGREAPVVGVEAPAALVTAALVCEAVVLPEEPPHAVKPKLASARTARTLAAGLLVPFRVCRALSMSGIELLVRGSC
jgi:hypothetical protein